MKRFASLILSVFLAAALFGCVDKPSLSDIDYDYVAEDKCFILTSKKDFTDVEITYITYDEDGIVTGTYSKVFKDLRANKSYRFYLSALAQWRTVDAEIIEIKGG